MLTNVVYNCNPESLGDVDKAAFVDAFENEVYAKPKWRETAVAVTFGKADSGVISFHSDDFEADVQLADELEQEFAFLAEKAFAACLITKQVQ